MPTTLSLKLTLNVVLSFSWELPIRARLTYSTDDPYAVSLAFQDQDGAEIVWALSRELLAEGLYGASGVGDVRIWPIRRGGESVLCLSLKSSEAQILMTTSRARVMCWLRRTENLIPIGSESEHLDLDASLVALVNE